MGQNWKIQKSVSYKRPKQFHLIVAQRLRGDLPSGAGARSCVLIHMNQFLFCFFLL